MARFRLEVEVAEKGWRTPGIVRLRKFLKSALRAYGINRSCFSSGFYGANENESTEN